MISPGWKFTINLAPMVYKDHVIAFAPGPQVRVNPKMIEYRDDIKQHIDQLIESPFNCNVELEIDMYMKEKRVAYPTSPAHVIAKCLVPNMIADPRLMKQVTSRVHYNDDNDKKWNPRIELTITPIIDNSV